MIRKVAIIVIGLFISILFLATFGSIYTGYTILEQKDITLGDYPFPFIKNNIPNQLLIVIPDDYTFQEYDAAIKISESLNINTQLSSNIIPVSRSPKEEYNLILIGDTCTNKLIAKELKTNNCNLVSESGYLELINKKRTSTLIVSGDIEKASTVLANYKFYPLRKNQITISGPMNSLILDYR
ncbi:hypothetical protein J4216_05845 [Candidatus Woesearchaeota archaeon]|nr:hypothetical protein [Candidatus Woesearchaeota archaeon]